MKIRLLVLWLLCLPYSGLMAQKAKKHVPLPLGNLIAVIDPGHGGSDPGSHGEAKGQKVNENVYVYDVALRVRRLIRKRGGISLLTTTGGGKENNSPASKIAHDSLKEHFALDGTIVKAGSSGLRKRIQYGNVISKKYPKRRQVWISIHFDVVGRDPSVSGVRVIQAGSSTTLGPKLIQSFKKAGRLRENSPLVKSGDQTHGIRRLYVLRESNHIKEKVLIELGNFLNVDDLWKIRDPNTREKYAQAIVDALHE